MPGKRKRKRISDDRPVSSEKSGHDSKSNERVITLRPKEEFILRDVSVKLLKVRPDEIKLLLTSTDASHCPGPDTTASDPNDA